MATDDQAPAEDPQLAAAEHDAPDDETISRAEIKPPRYRIVRGTVYALYMVVLVWFCISVTVAVWRSVWGEPGQRLQQQEQQERQGWQDGAKRAP